MIFIGLKKHGLSYNQPYTETILSIRYLYSSYNVSIIFLIETLYLDIIIFI